MNGDKRRKRNAKTAQGYDANTPRCDTCVHRQPAGFGRPDQLDPTTGVAGPLWQPYVPARCLIGDFPVQPVGLCDDWEGRDGSKLEVDE